MRLIIGGAYQGKKEYVKRKYHIEESQVWQGGYPVAEGDWKCINGLHNIIKSMLAMPTGQYNGLREKTGRSEDEPDGKTEFIIRQIHQMVGQRPGIVLICDEVGGGIVPVEKADRDYRECVGRALCELAKTADTVERVHCGIGHTVKSTVYVSFLRHGATEGNLLKRYIGVTDEPLCREGIADLEKKKKGGFYPPVRQVVASPMKRCLETAGILYPGVPLQTQGAFHETDFGLFEGKNYGELKSDDRCRDAYQAWIDSDGRMPFPEGESMEQMSDRCAAAFERMLPSLDGDTALVVHGGTVMSILSTYAEPHRDYYDYRCGNGEGYLCRVELTGDRKLFRMTVAGRIGREKV